MFVEKNLSSDRSMHENLSANVAIVFGIFHYGFKKI